jgi:hypothetical protein
VAKGIRKLNFASLGYSKSMASLVGAEIPGSLENPISFFPNKKLLCLWTVVIGMVARNIFAALVPIQNFGMPRLHVIRRGIGKSTTHFAKPDGGCYESGSMPLRANRKQLPSGVFSRHWYIRPISILLERT